MSVYSDLPVSCFGRKEGTEKQERSWLLVSRQLFVDLSFVPLCVIANLFLAQTRHTEYIGQRRMNHVFQASYYLL